MSFVKRLALATALAAAAAAFAPAGSLAGQADPSPPPSDSAPAIPSPVPATEDPKLHKLAVQQFLAWQQGKIDHALYTDNINNELTDDVVSRGSATLANMGPLQSATFRGVSHAKQGDLYVFRMTCDHGSVDMDLGIDPKGLISAIFFE